MLVFYSLEKNIGEIESLQKISLEKNIFRFSNKSNNDNNFKKYKKINPNLFHMVFSFLKESTIYQKITYLLLLAIISYLYYSCLVFVLFGNLQYLIKENFLFKNFLKIPSIIQKESNTPHETKNIRNSLREIFIILYCISIVIINHFIFERWRQKVIEEYYNTYIGHLFDCCSLSQDIELEKLIKLTDNLKENVNSIGQVIFGSLSTLIILAILVLQINQKDLSDLISKEVSLTSLINYWKTKTQYLLNNKQNLLGISEANTFSILLELLEFRISSKYLSDFGNLLEKFTAIDQIYVTKFKELEKVFNFLKNLSYLMISFISLFICYFFFISKNIIGKSKFIDKRKEYFDLIKNSYDTFNSANLNENLLNEFNSKADDKNNWKSINFIQLFYFLLVVLLLISFFTVILILPKEIPGSDLKNMFIKLPLFYFGMFFMIIKSNQVYNLLYKSSPLLEVFSRLNIFEKPMKKKVLLSSDESVVEIKLRNVKIGYDIPVGQLKELDVGTGMTIMLQGPSGEGKTTLLNTILNGINSLGGSITAVIKNRNTLKTKEVDINQISKRDLYRFVGYCPQFFKVTEINLRDLILSPNNLTEEQGEILMNYVEMAKWFKSLPEGWDTFFPDLNSLSGGQRNLLYLCSVLARFVDFKKETEDKIDLFVLNYITEIEKHDGLTASTREKIKGFKDFLLFGDEFLDNVSPEVAVKIIIRLSKWIILGKIGFVIVTHNPGHLLAYSNYLNVLVSHGVIEAKEYHYADSL